MRSIRVLLFFAAAVLFIAGPANAQTGPTPVTKGKTPIIIIPGLTGSDLVNSKTGEEVWFKVRRSKDDDIRLPISPILSRNRDSLVPKDILRSVKFLKFLPETEIYERLVNALETRGGFHEAKWNTTNRADAEDTFYVFPYDWRRDNVENARLLITRIQALKRRLKTPNLKFNIVAHSMGGIIARYAAMYGDNELPVGTNVKPTWAGARDLKRVFLVGTPNEGSVSAIDAFINGFSYIGGGLNLPFIQDISRFDVFTIPAMYQLLPHEGTLIAYDDSLKPYQIDVYDPATWDRLGWDPILDPSFKKKFNPAEQRVASAYFLAALSRAKRLQTALDANTSETIPIQFYLMGADCKETPNAILLTHDDKKDRWETRFKPDSFTNAKGEKITSEQLKPLMTAMGDSVVTKRSLSGETRFLLGKKTILPITSEVYQCEAHSKLVTNPEIQDRLFNILNAAALGAK